MKGPGLKGHSATYRGKWVRVELRDGRRFTAQFLERSGHNHFSFRGVSRRIRSRDMLRFICFGSFSPNSAYSKGKPWDNVTLDQV